MEALREFTYEECNKWLVPELLTQHRAQAIRGRYADRQVRDLHDGKPRAGSGVPSSIVCPKCKGQHMLESCSADSASNWPRWLAEGVKKKTSAKQTVQGRLKAGKCLCCGGPPHRKGVRCKERPPQKEKDGGR